MAATPASAHDPIGQPEGPVARELLRACARTEPDEVRRYAAAHEAKLSKLTRREEHRLIARARRTVSLGKPMASVTSSRGAPIDCCSMIGGGLAVQARIGACERKKR